jgi:hypothetical protein
LNFEASGENAILGELSQSIGVFLFYRKKALENEGKRVGVEKEEEEVGITKLCRK